MLPNWWLPYHIKGSVQGCILLQCYSIASNDQQLLPGIYLLILHRVRVNMITTAHQHTEKVSASSLILAGSVCKEQTRCRCDAGVLYTCDIREELIQTHCHQTHPNSLTINNTFINYTSVMHRRCIQSSLGPCGKLKICVTLPDFCTRCAEP